MNSNIFKPSLFKRMLVVLIAAYAVVLVSVYLQGLYFTHNAANGSFDQEMLEVSDALMQVLNLWSDQPQAQVALEAVTVTLDATRALNASHPDFLVFYVWDKRSTLVHKSTVHDPSHLAPYEIQGFGDLNTPSTPTRVYGAWSLQGLYFVEVTQTKASRLSQYNGVMLGTRAFQVALVGFAFLLIPAMIAAQFGLRPLRQIVKELKQRTAIDLSPLASRSNYLEISALVSAFNAALARVNDLLARERSFVADAAHELRTPLAVITAQVDNLITAVTPEARETAGNRLKNGVQRANRLSNQLLLLAQLEAHAAVHHSYLDIADVIREALASHAKSAHAKNIECSYDGPEHIQAYGIAEAIESIIENIIGNSVKHGKNGGQLEVRAQVRDAQVHIDIADDGPGIGTLGADAIFERFRRGDASKTTGSGLGLAIVHAAAEQVRARVGVAPGLAGQGVTFSIEIALQATLT